jgi:hypothetical protein
MFAATIAALALLVVGVPMTASAGGDDLVKGVNGVVTSPLDAALGLVETKRLVDMGQLHEKLAPVNVVTDRLGGAGFGLFTAVKRAALGLVDVVTFPITEKVKGPHSPDARYRVFEKVEVE